MPGTAVDELISTLEEQREQIWIATRRQQETQIKLHRFDDQMREVSCWDDERERAVWAEACRVVAVMLAQAAKLNRAPMRLLMIMVPATGPVFRCSFAWELGAAPQPGDVLLALHILNNRRIDDNERSSHVDFLRRYSWEDEDRRYWQIIQKGKQPTLSVWEQIRLQAQTEMSAKGRSKGVVWTPLEHPQTLWDIEEV